MNRSISEKRPWLAALLAVFATGLGHLYLRRWRRALGWIAVLFVTAVLFVDPSPSNIVTRSGMADLPSALPVLFVGAISVVDAYVLAHAQNESARQTISIRGDVPDRTHRPCPNCGKKLDPELTFCHWCTTDLDRLEKSPSDDQSGTDEQ